MFKSAVLELRVTPLITPDNRLILDLNVKKDRVGTVIVTVWDRFGATQTGFAVNRTPTSLRSRQATSTGASKPSRSISNSNVSGTEFA